MCYFDSELYIVFCCEVWQHWLVTSFIRPSLLQSIPVQLYSVLTCPGGLWGVGVTGGHGAVPHR